MVFTLAKYLIIRSGSASPAMWFWIQPLNRLPCR